MYTMRHIARYNSLLFMMLFCAVLAALSTPVAAQDSSARTVRDGLWSESATWVSGHAPSEDTTQVRMQHDVVLDANFAFGGTGSFDALLGPGYSSSNTLYIDAELHIYSPGGNRAVLMGFQGPGLSEGWLHIRDGGLLAVNENIWLGHWQGSPRGIGRGHLLVEPGGRLEVAEPGAVYVGWQTEAENPPPHGSSFRVLGGGGTIEPQALYLGDGAILSVAPRDNGAAGLSRIDATALHLAASGATLEIAPDYAAAVGDGWEIAQWDTLYNQFAHIVTVPPELAVDVAYEDDRLIASVTAIPEPPEAPTDLTASAYSWDAVLLEWNDVASSGYVIERGTDGQNFPERIEIDGPEDSYLDSSLEPETTYHYRVYARTHYGESDALTAQVTTRERISGLSNEALVAMRDGFDTRRDAAFEKLRGQELVVADLRDPLGEGRPLYTRHYSFSIMNFAMRAMWNNEQLDVANEALYDHSVYYLENPAERNDRDNLHWVTNTLSRLLEFYGSNGSRAAGRVTPETEAKIFELMHAYMQDNAYYADTQRNTWHIGIWEKWILDPSIPVPPTSENHHLMKFATIWHFSKFLMEHPDYKDATYDGHTAAEYYAAWTDFAEEYFLERARRSLFVEMASGNYGPRTLEGIYNFYDFGEGDLQRLAGYMLDLYYASWAQEQIDGVRGGGKARMYQSGGDRIGLDSVSRLAWYYLEVGQEQPPGQEMMTVLTSDYRMPLVLMDIALDVEGRDRYEVRERRAGLEEAWGVAGFEMREDFGGILRYSYCTPAYVMGLPLLESRPFQDWAIMSAQNRWQGVIFAGEHDARIVSQFRGEGQSRADNALWGVQKKGSMLTQRLPDGYTRFIPNAPSEDVPITHGMRVWFSEAGLENYVEREGWVFVETPKAYAAVRPARGDYEWYDSEDRFRGTWLAMHDWDAPVIIEVAEQVDFASYAAFQEAVLALDITWEGDVLHYTGLSDDTLTLYTDHSQTPEINGETIDLAPDQVFASPYLNADWEAGVVTVSKGYREYVMDFNHPEDRPRHAADHNADQRIDMAELLRVVQLYNVGDYHCSLATEDGYAPGHGNRDCQPHSSDYLPQNWRIRLSELLRLVQLYNAAGYELAEDSEDGFAPMAVG